MSSFHMISIRSRPVIPRLDRGIQINAQYPLDPPVKPGDDGCPWQRASCLGGHR
jgi:hypothetical protein